MKAIFSALISICLLAGCSPSPKMHSRGVFVFSGFENHDNTGIANFLVANYYETSKPDSIKLVDRKLSTLDYQTLDVLSLGAPYEEINTERKCKSFSIFFKTPKDLDKQGYRFLATLKTDHQPDQKVDVICPQPKTVDRVLPNRTGND